MATKQLTDRQRRVYELIRDLILNRGYGPTVREIGEAFGIKSPNGVMCHLRALERKGWIKRDHYLSRGITLVAEPVTQMITLTPGEAGCLGEIYVGCVGVKDRSVTLELIAPDIMGEIRKDL